MEALSKGASETKGSVVEGVISPAAFPERNPNGNEYLNKVTRVDDIESRIVTLRKKADVFVVLPGAWLSLSLHLSNSSSCFSFCPCLVPT